MGVSFEKVGSSLAFRIDEHWSLRLRPYSRREARWVSMTVVWQDGEVFQRLGGDETFVWARESGWMTSHAYCHPPGGTQRSHDGLPGKVDYMADAVRRLLVYHDVSDEHAAEISSSPVLADVVERVEQYWSLLTVMTA